MSSFKKLNKADVTTVNYHANKQWLLNYPSSSIDNDPNLRIYTGTYITGTFYSNNTSIDPYTGGQYERLIYDSMNHLFYQNYTNLLNTGSIMFNIDTYQSASQQRPTASYFDYNTNPLFINQFPTGAGASIRVLSINQDLYGSKVLPTSFKLTASSDILIRDDGNGNLYNVAGAQNQYIDLNYVTIVYFSSGSIIPVGAEFVGNIFYAHGIAVITNSDYQGIFPYPPLAISDSRTYTVYNSPYNPTHSIDILSNDFARTGILLTGSVVLSGSKASYYTVNSNGTLTLSSSAKYPGDYSVYYTVNNSFNNGTSSLTSNKALLNVNLVASTASCILYQFSGSSVGAAFTYVTCSSAFEQNETVGQNIITRCIKATEIPSILTGTGGITIISGC
jgi:hypothetical protein